VWLYQNFIPFLKSGYQQPMIELEFENPIIKKIDLGWGFVGVVDEEGKVYLWGDNYAGQLGLGDDVHRDHPIINKTLFDQHIVDISCGFQHILFLTKEGSVFGVGKNDRFQLGKEKRDADESGEVTGVFGLPSQINGFNEFDTSDVSEGDYYSERIVQIEAGKFHSLFLSDSGNIYALGNNIHGQLGFSSYLYKSAEKPTLLMLDGLKVKQIASGFHHNLVLSEEGKIYGFGSDAVGQIRARNNSEHQGFLSIHTTGKDVPMTEIKLPTDAKWVKVMANNVRSCAMMDNGEVWFWGGYFYANERRKKLFIDDYNLLNEEKGISDNWNIVDYQMGFAHDVIMTEESREITLEDAKTDVTTKQDVHKSQII
jgi:alpha-tubulin suppressor-like RCC1 family protein